MYIRMYISFIPLLLYFIRTDRIISRVKFDNICYLIYYVLKYAKKIFFNVLSSKIMNIMWLFFIALSSIIKCTRYLSLFQNSHRYIRQRFAFLNREKNQYFFDSDFFKIFAQFYRDSQKMKN